MKKNILVCDDDLGILEIVSIILKEKGYQVTAISDSEVVLETIKKTSPDLILLDLWMPNISGEELTMQLKEDEKTKNIPIVIVSASKDTKNISETIGADGFIIKPFDIEELEKLVEKYLT